MPSCRDLTGLRFGRLVARSAFSVRCGTRSRIAWHCICDCGNAVTVKSLNLLAGDTRSCGCLRNEAAHKAHKHGAARQLKKTPEYIAWLGMKDRCSNPHNHQYSNYGGRGISVCESWLNDFSAFYRSMGSKPTAKHSIDRIDNDGNYELANCRWATPSEQAFNRRPKREQTYLYIIDGTPLQHLALLAGLDPITVRRRYRKGERGARLFSKDLRAERSKKPFNGPAERRQS